MKVSMIGCGYVGLVTGSCLAEVGHEMTCIDVDEKKLALLREGHSPIYEVGLEKLIQDNMARGRLHFSNDLAASLKDSKAVFVAVGTPPDANGAADLRAVFACAGQIGESMQHDLIVIVKSTVPVGTCDRVEGVINEVLAKRKSALKAVVVSNPEFLKEGKGVYDFMHPDRIVIGLKDEHGRAELEELYRSFAQEDPHKLMVVGRRASEMIKYASNAMLATRISFMNEMAILCEKLECDVEQVRVGIGHDPRIGKKFLYAGPGFGGSCFPKDTDALLSLAADNGVKLSILESVQKANEAQKIFAVKKVLDYFGPGIRGKKIALWGLAYKPGTDDVRQSPSTVIVSELVKAGAQVVAHDPQAKERFAHDIGNITGLSYADAALEAVDGADALVLVTEWTEYQKPNWPKIAEGLKSKVVFDFRNQYDFELLSKMGFHYQCIGRRDSAGA